MPTVTSGTNIPPPQWNPATGFVSASESAILAGAQADYANAFKNANLNFSLNTPQGQLTSQWAASVGVAQDNFVLITQMVDPAYAQGRFQDAIGRIYFMERNGAQPTVLQILCSGGTNVVIPPNAKVVDGAGNVYACALGGTIPGAGNVTLPFVAVVPGPTPVPVSVSIYTAVSGWDSASVSSGTVGTPTESRGDFEARRQATVESNAMGIIGSIVGAVADVAGVLDYYGDDNPSNSPVTKNGVTIGANSIYIAAVGGTDTNVAQAILTKKPPGIPMTGNTTVTVYDSNPLFVTPRPYSITFERPPALKFTFAVIIVNTNLVPSDYVTQVQNAVVNAWNGGFIDEEGNQLPRARIGAEILSSDYIDPIKALGSWARVKSIYLGSNNDADAAQFTGAIAGTTLTVSGVTGTIVPNMTLFGAGIPAGTYIVSGSGTTWTINVSLTVGSEAMKGVPATQQSSQVNGNQTPTLSAADVFVSAA